jgi:DNA polymerase
MLHFVDLDFETQSSADLPLVGAEAYAQDPTTVVLCLNWSVDYGPKQRWFPGDATDALTALVDDTDMVFVAHNAAFEQAIWRWIMVRDFGLPYLSIERWEDTMAVAAWRGWPLKLERVARMAGIPQQKDMEGSRLTIGLSRMDKKTGNYPVCTPAILKRVADYCDQDVEVESALRRRMGLLSGLSEHERAIWVLDQRINQRGVRIDLDYVRAANRVVKRATGPMLDEFRDLTDGLNPGQRDKLIAWAAREGVPMADLRKETIDNVLDAEEVDEAGYVSNAEEDNDDVSGSPVSLPNRTLPETVRRVLQIRQTLGSSSIKKLDRMLHCVSPDGRVRGLLQYHAAGTGRWGGRLLQPQNFPRGSLTFEAGVDPVTGQSILKAPSPESVVDAIMSGDPEYVEMVLGKPAIECVISGLRHALIADPGKVFLVGDFAGIEARIVLAMAGQHDKTAMMASGQDVYLDMARRIYNREVTKANLVERQMGKATILGCGFQMGWRTFKRRVCPDLPDEFAQTVIEAYRKQWAPKIPGLWYGLNDAALKAARDSVVTEAYGVRYAQRDGFLVAALPSGWQRLWYHRPHYVPYETEQEQKDRYGKDHRPEYRSRPFWKYDTYKGGKVSHRNAYGGLLTENAVQGLARGLLAASMFRLEREGFPIVLTVHDECIAEVDEDKADEARFTAAMAEPTAWAERMRIPINVETWSGRRYKK